MRKIAKTPAEDRAALFRETSEVPGDILEDFNMAGRSATSLAGTWRAQRTLVS